jgi:DNA-binding transcriptional MerR regulator
MRMQKKQFRIGTLAKKLKVEKFVIRFWEKEFDLKTTRSEGGQRFYDEEAAHQFQTIKELLYEKRFTIEGARQYIQQAHPTKKILGSKTSTTGLDSYVTKKLALLQQQLIQLRESL